MITAEQLYRSPNALAGFYGRFRVAERLLLTGHSHQAWPDCGFEGQQKAWLDAAELLDRKWERCFAQAALVRAGFARLVDDSEGSIALGPSTHDLLVRFLSALPLSHRPRLVSTDGEFRSLSRQLDRLAEEGIEIVRVPASPAASVAERLVAETDERTSAVLVSSVFFTTGEIVPGLGSVMEQCRKSGSELLVDAYHSLNVVPFSLGREGLGDAFVVGGGYKYCQLGEGNCFLRIPANCRMRPAVTGWFSEFERLESATAGPVSYGPGPARFAGSTYDPTSHYRAAEVFAFFERHGLGPELLREASQHQLGVLAQQFDRMDLDPGLIARDRSVGLGALGGFLVLDSPRAREICAELHKRGVQADHRGSALRLGPAPYVSDGQLRDAMGILEGVCRELATASRGRLT